MGNGASIESNRGTHRQDLNDFVMVDRPVIDTRYNIVVRSGTEAPTPTRRTQTRRTVTAVKMSEADIKQGDSSPKKNSTASHQNQLSRRSLLSFPPVSGTPENTPLDKRPSVSLVKRSPRHMQQWTDWRAMFKQRPLCYIVEKSSDQVTTRRFPLATLRPLGRMLAGLSSSSDASSKCVAARAEDLASGVLSKTWPHSSEKSALSPTHRQQTHYYVVLKSDDRSVAARIPQALIDRLFRERVPQKKTPAQVELINNSSDEGSSTASLPSSSSDTAEPTMRVSQLPKLNAIEWRRKILESLPSSTLLLGADRRTLRGLSTNGSFTCGPVSKQLTKQDNALLSKLEKIEDARRDARWRRSKLGKSQDTILHSELEKFLSYRAQIYQHLKGLRQGPVLSSDATAHLQKRLAQLTSKAVASLEAYETRIKQLITHLPSSRRI